MKAVMALAAASVALTVAGPGVATAGAASRLMVSADEYSLVLSRQSIARGPSLVQLVNRGEDPHDLKVRRIGANSGIAFPEVRSLGLAERTIRLRPGRYRLWCSVSGHARLGMKATLRVRR